MEVTSLFEEESAILLAYTSSYDHGNLVIANENAYFMIAFRIACRGSPDVQLTISRHIL